MKKFTLFVIGVLLYYPTREIEIAHEKLLTLSNTAFLFLFLLPFFSLLKILSLKMDNWNDSRKMIEHEETVPDRESMVKKVLFQSLPDAIIFCGIFVTSFFISIRVHDPDANTFFGDILASIALIAIPPFSLLFITLLASFLMTWFFGKKYSVKCVK